jgi:hypothetical protein
MNNSPTPVNSWYSAFESNFIEGLINIPMLILKSTPSWVYLLVLLIIVLTVIAKRKEGKKK